MATTQFVVQAAANSVSGGVGLNTGINVVPGDLLTISVDPNDLWRAGNGPRESNANGLGNPFGNGFGTYTKNGSTFLFGSLVGSLNNGATFFPVGTRLEMTMVGPGTLTLHYWDSNNADNSGSVTATVVLYKGPVY